MDLKVFPLTKDSIHLFKDCFEANGSPKKEENIEWQFLQNTEKSCYVDISFDETNKKTAAIYAVSSVKFKVNDAEVKGTQSLDTMTDVAYRGKGLFTKLANSVYEKAANDNVALVYGFPNGNSIHGFKKKLEWEVLDPLPFLIKPLKTKYFTNKIKPLTFLPNINLSFSKFRANKNFIIKENTSFPNDVNELWHSFSSHFKVGVVRDKDYLEWRYLNKPNEEYKIAHCYDSENKYLGYVIYIVKEKHNGRIGYIMELIFDTTKPNAGNQLLKYAISEIKKEHADCILSWCLEHSPNYATYKKNFFINMPDKIRPIELHFGARSFKPELKDVISNRANWYLSYSDSDTV